jgi:hypothetical protein
VDEDVARGPAVKLKSADVTKIAKQMKRSTGALRQQALKLGIGLEHRR